MPGAPAGIRLIDVAKSYGPRTVLAGVSLDVPSGSVYVLCGPNGAGKTTLLRTLLRLERVDRGEIWVGRHAVTGRVDLRALRREAAIVFQSGALYPHLTVLDNLTLAPCKAQGWRRADAEAEALACLDRFGLANRAQSYPHHLSGGEQRRVAVARALVGRPRVLLLDEPTASLDPASIQDVLAVVRDAIGGGTTTLIVTHELHFAAEVADQMGFLDGGKLLYEGSPAGFFTASVPAIQRFLAGDTRNQASSFDQPAADAEPGTGLSRLRPAPFRQ